MVITSIYIGCFLFLFIYLFIILNNFCWTQWDAVASFPLLPSELFQVSSPFPLTQRACLDFLSLSSLFWEQRKWHAWNPVTDAQIRQHFHCKHIQPGFPTSKREVCSEMQSQVPFCSQLCCLFDAQALQCINILSTKTEGVHPAVRSPCCNQYRDCRLKRPHQDQMEKNELKNYHHDIIF